MHRDYTIDSPVQIRRYSNRIEFENAGYSLKPEDQLGLPGSITRNTKIATILHDINLAETKGTGIRAMRDSMQEANLTVPLIESKRASNQFILTLLTHHLFDQKDIEWLSCFKGCHLSDEEARALIILREMGAITNADFRAINTVDTLSASNSLRRLRDLGLLEQRGGGASTYYLPGRKVLISHEEKRSPQIREGAPQIREKTVRGVGQEKLPNLTPELKEKLDKLGKRASPKKIREAIKDICSLGYIGSEDIAALVKRDVAYIRNSYLYPMVNTGELEYLYPEKPAHPKQAYSIRKQNE